MVSFLVVSNICESDSHHSVFLFTSDSLFVGLFQLWKSAMWRLEITRVTTANRKKDCMGRFCSIRPHCFLNAFSTEDPVAYSRERIVELASCGNFAGGIYTCGLWSNSKPACCLSESLHSICETFSIPHVNFYWFPVSCAKRIEVFGHLFFTI